MCCNRGPSRQSGTLLCPSWRYFLRSLEFTGHILTGKQISLLGNSLFPLQCLPQNQRVMAKRTHVTAFGLFYAEKSARSKNEALGALPSQEQMRKISSDWQVLPEDEKRPYRQAVERRQAEAASLVGPEPHRGASPKAQAGLK